MIQHTIISVTSWKKRITSVGLTIFSILHNNPSYLVVLTLSELEFPNRESDLPKDLLIMQHTGNLEIAWVPDNPKERKKLRVFELYPDTPSIFIDDDMVYLPGFCDEMYNAHVTNPKAAITYVDTHYKYGVCMACSLFPPAVYDAVLSKYHSNPNMTDDILFPQVFQATNTPVVALHNHFPGYFHNEVSPMNGSDKFIEWKRMQIFK